MCDRTICDRCSIIETYIAGVDAIARLTFILSSPTLTQMLVDELAAAVPSSGRPN